MLTPAYKLQIGHKTVDTTEEPQASTVVDLLVSLDLDTPADRFLLALGQVGGIKPTLQDEATLELGYADDGSMTQVMVANVVTIDSTLVTTRVTGYTATQGLLRTFVDQTYESKDAGSIVRDLADKAGVDVATADTGIDFPAYVIDGQRSVYRHMRELADLCGFDLYLNSDGKLVFQRFGSGQSVHVFEYAKDIVSLEASRTPPRTGKVQAWGESPGASSGDDSWAWLTKDFSGLKGEAGSDSPVELLERPALRTARAAATAANGAFSAIKRRTLRGRLRAVGRPEVKLGDAIRLSKVPDDSLNRNYQVRAVTHRITKRDGFTTTVGFRALNA